ncbi:hypothetical protein N9994_00300 [bacterium]|nr:hypothetical protein [bacterium]
MSKFITDIGTVLSSLTSFVSDFPTKKRNINPLLLQAGLKSTHEGISTKRIEAEIINKKNEAKGMDFRTSPSLNSGDTNMDMVAERIRIEAIINELLEHSFVDVVISAESIAASIASLGAKTTTGGASPTIPAEGKGIIR